MYPADDILIRVRLATEQARALKASIDTQLARARALHERARSRGRTCIPRDAALVIEIGEVERTSRLLLEDAREHRRRSQLLVEQSRRRRGGVAVERG